MNKGREPFWQRLAKWVVATVVVTVALYQGYLFVLPSITVINASGGAVSVTVRLPSNRLDFGRIAPGADNTLYYTLAQQPGDYRYRLQRSGAEVTGHCGRVAENEVHKRVKMTIGSDGQLRCLSNNNLER
ncbi:hypothetical protein [Ferrimonas sp. SCSIO 43195]|uniref:hypothetical protein n=1 Tax=Ferrimonas sp. SCSIO 43195 TaxID=2822844 RepID=UPI0020761AAC|nr:hypothetical protein [Ferrimonas sp. SCSIO 43195]USD39498.1 hypothetical protein J8Z22_10635 [Ferrimonas sp. SCSIO 43195]